MGFLKAWKECDVTAFEALDVIIGQMNQHWSLVDDINPALFKVMTKIVNTIEARKDVQIH